MVMSPKALVSRTTQQVRKRLRKDRSELYLQRQLFNQTYETRPASTRIDLEVEAPRTIVRSTPKFAEPLPGHSAFWGHSSYPFSRPEYVSRGLNVWKVERVSVCGRKGGLFFDDHTYERTAFEYFNWDNSDLCPKPVDGGMMIDLTRCKRIESPTFLGFNGGHTNYAHWFTDHLVMLYVYTQHYQAKGFKIALPDNLTGFAKDTVSLMGIAPSDIVYLKNDIVAFDDLRVTSFFAFTETPAFYDAAVEKLIQACRTPGAEQQGYRKIYISRRDASARPILNVDEVESLAVEYGFELLVTGQMSLKEQIAAFQGARIVVGPHGAGLINSIFCPPGATLIELFPEYMLGAQFWTSASLRGLEYGYLCGTSFDPDWASQKADSAWESASIVDTAALRSLLRTLEATAD